MSKKIFISYRREDSRWESLHLYKALTQVLPPDHVFLDVDAIPLGLDFVQHLQGWVQQCDVLLAMMGRGWLQAEDPSTGVRRLDDPNDFVRIEIAYALHRGILVVPVLLDGTRMPRELELPEAIRALARRQAASLEHGRADADVARLLQGLGLGEESPFPEQIFNAPRDGPKRRRSSSISSMGGNQPPEQAANAPKNTPKPRRTSSASATSGNQALTKNTPKRQSTSSASAKSGEQALTKNTPKRQSTSSASATSGDQALEQAVPKNTPKHRRTSSTSATSGDQALPKNTPKRRRTSSASATSGSQAQEHPSNAPKDNPKSRPSGSMLATDRRLSQEQVSRASWATTSGLDEYGQWASVQISNVEMKLRWIEPGEFLIGSPENEEGRSDNEVQHEVKLSQGFWLGETPVTQALWTAVMGENPSKFKRPTRPVEQVSWEDTQDFLRKLNGHHPELNLRLPTEAEWEYACRAGSEVARYGELAAVAWYDGNSGGRTHRVKAKEANAWGLYDMLGNVWEWCQDWYGEYDQSMVLDPFGLVQGSDRVARGGCWFNDACHVRAAYRSGNTPSSADDGLGFRLAQNH